MMRSLASVVFLAILVSSCCREVVTRPVNLPLPRVPHWQPVSPSELACLSEETYAKLAQQKAELKAAYLECRAIINSTRTDR